MAFTKSSLPCFGQERSKFLCHLSIRVKQSKSSCVYEKKGQTGSISKAHSSLGGIQKLLSAMFACLEICRSVTSQISTRVSHGSVISLENCPVPAESAMPRVDIKKVFWHKRKASFSKGMHVVGCIYTQSSNFINFFFKRQALGYWWNMTLEEVSICRSRHLMWVVEYSLPLHSAVQEHSNLTLKKLGV